jgi:hypothetical protein
MRALSLESVALKPAGPSRTLGQELRIFGRVEEIIGRTETEEVEALGDAQP